MVSVFLLLLLFSLFVNYLLGFFYGLEKTHDFPMSISFPEINEILLLLLFIGIVNVYYI